MVAVGRSAFFFFCFPMGALGKNSKSRENSLSSNIGSRREMEAGMNGCCPGAGREAVCGGPLGLRSRLEEQDSDTGKHTRGLW